MIWLSIIVGVAIGLYISYRYEVKVNPHHYEDWKRWSEKSLNGWFYKFCVLVGFTVSPTFTIEKSMRNYDIEYTKDIDTKNCVMKINNPKVFFDEEEK